MASSHKSKKPTILSPAVPVPISRSVISSDEESDAADVAGPSRRVGDVDSSDIDEDDEEDEDEVPDLMDAVERGVGGKGKRKEYSSYKPPSGMSELKVSPTFASSPFEWDEMSKKAGLEVWAIRVPLNFKPSRMANIQIHLPPSTHSNPSPQPIGNLTTSKHSYILRSAHSSSSTTTSHHAQPMLADSMAMDTDPFSVGLGARSANDLKKADEGDKGRQGEIVDELMRSGGEEMEGLRLVLPRMSKGGNLFAAPKPITRHLILTPSEDPLPTPSDLPSLDMNSTDPCLRPLPTFISTTPAPPADVAAIVPPRGEGKRAQPLDKLKYRNVPFGSGLSTNVGMKRSMVDGQGDVVMDEEMETPRKKRKEGGEGKKKKKEKV